MNTTKRYGQQPQPNMIYSKRNKRTIIDKLMREGVDIHDLLKSEANVSFKFFMMVVQTIILYFAF